VSRFIVSVPHDNSTQYSSLEWRAVDVNECADVTSTCGFGAKSCNNDAGGYTCTCLSGYEFKNGKCIGNVRLSSVIIGSNSLYCKYSTVQTRSSRVRQ